MGGMGFKCKYWPKYCIVIFLSLCSSIIIGRIHEPGINVVNYLMACIIVVATQLTRVFWSTYLSIAPTLVLYTHKGGKRFSGSVLFTYK